MKFIKIFAIVVLAMTTVACSTKEQKDDINVIPYPNHVQLASGCFNAAGAPFYYAPETEVPAVDVIKAFAAQLSMVSSEESVVNEGAGESGFIFTVNAELPKEAYTLEVDKKAVKVEASSLRGFN